MSLVIKTINCIGQMVKPPTKLVKKVKLSFRSAKLPVMLKQNDDPWQEQELAGAGVRGRWLELVVVGAGCS